MHTSTVFSRQLRRYVGLVFQGNALVATTLPNADRNRAACAAVVVSRLVKG